MLKLSIIKSIVIFSIGLNFLFAPSDLFGQQKAFKTFGNKFNFEYDTRGQMGSTGFKLVNIPDTAIYKALGYSENDGPVLKPKSAVLLGVKLGITVPDAGRYPIKSLSKTYSVYLIPDGSEARIVAMGINSTNIKDYQYRVVEDDSLEIVPWSAIPGLQQNYGAKQPYGFIGKFKSPGKQLFVEVRNIKKYGIRDGIIFDWRINHKPKIKEFSLNGLKNGKLFSAFLLEGESNEGLATRFDPETRLPLDLKFQFLNLGNLYIKVDDYQDVPYDIIISKISNDTVEVRKAEIGSTSNLKIISTRDFDSPGKYEITISRSKLIGDLQKNNRLIIPFEILPGTFGGWNMNGYTSSFIVIVIGFIFTLGFSFYARNKEKIRKADRDRQLATLKLKSIRSQLNPHFMFNALSSIQNLVNKNNIIDANFYLSKFAGLTRQVLDSNNENMISLDDEIKMLTDYLEMEQLRFNFKFEIKIDPLLNQANIEVPAMLLQPFIENAVKHGVSALKEGGLINIIINGIDKDLELIIEDNGGGYDQNSSSSGYGIKLSEERVELLNQLYKGQSVSLTTSSTTTGTTIIVRLSNWIS